MESTEDEIVSDKMKGELRILGRRQTAVTPQAICDYLDLLVGTQVAEVIMNNLEFRLGKEEAELFLKERSNSTTSDIIALMIKYDALTGMGVTEVRLPKIDEDPVLLRISNPSVVRTEGASKSFLFSWWCGALTTLLKKEMRFLDVTYDEEQNTVQCKITPRPTDHEK